MNERSKKELESRKPSAPPQSRSPLHTKVLLLLLLAALAMRVIHGIGTWQDNPRTRLLTADALYYDTWSEKIANNADGIETPLYLPPLYPYILAMVRLVAGASLPYMIIIQAILGLLNLWLIHRLTRRHFSEQAALFAMLPALFYASFIFFETRLMATTLTITLGLSAVMLLERALARGTLPALATAGLCIGVLCEARPNFLIYGALAAGAVFFHTKKPLGHRLRSMGMLALCVFIPLTFSLAYNVAKSGEWILVTGNGGLNFYFGNHLGASGVNDAPTRDFSSIFDQKATARRLAEAERHKPLTQTEVSDYWFQKGMEYIRTEPGAWVRLVMKKLRLFLSSFGYGVIYVPEVEQHLSPVLRLHVLPAGMLLALGAGGMWLALRRNRSRLWPLLLFLATNLATVLAFFMSERFRLPFMAGLMPFAGLFLSKGWECLKARSYPKLVAGSVFTILFTAGSYYLVDEEIRDSQCCRAQISLAAAFLQAGNLDQARIESQSALKIKRTPAGLHNLGLIEEAADHQEQAVVLFEEASRIDPTYLEPLGSLAEIYEKTEEWEKALEMRARMIEIVPHRYEAYFNMGLTCIDAGRTEQGLEYLEKAAEKASGQARVWELLGQAYHEAGKPEKALEALRKASEIDPDLRSPEETVEAWKNKEKTY
ncbi:MAG: tetratricopeptide repeat protein [Planctomycetota bacterium]